MGVISSADIPIQVSSETNRNLPGDPMTIGLLKQILRATSFGIKTSAERMKIYYIQFWKQEIMDSSWRGCHPRGSVVTKPNLAGGRHHFMITGSSKPIRWGTS